VGLTSLYMAVMMSDWRMLSTMYLLTYKKVTFNNGVSFMQTNISVFTVISELQ